MSEECATASDPLPISLVAHTVFCTRRAWLEANGETVSHAQLEHGYTAHRRVDDPGASTRKTTRSMAVHHASLGLTGKCDVVESSAAGALVVVDYKTTPVRRRAEVTSAQRVQLTLQRLCLEDMGFDVESTKVYFVNHNVHVAVDRTEEAVAEAKGYVSRTREVIESTEAPPPLLDDARCRWCSHASVCLPDEHLGRNPARSIAVRDPDGEILHLTTFGARAALGGGRVKVVKGDEDLASVAIERVQGLVVHGNVDVSSGLLRELLWRGVTVVWCSSRGRVMGWARSAESPNGGARVSQHVRSADGDLGMAEEMVSTKISNQATQLRRNASPGDRVIADMRELSKRALSAASLPEVFALEGQAAAVYFSWFPEMLSEPQGDAFRTAWPGRSGRGAGDPLNAALNYVYGLLLGEVVRAVVACGLDPSAGFLHSSSRNKPALALDIMEEFRAPLADSSVIWAINNGELREDMFFRGLGDARLTDAGRKALVRAFERRMTTEIQHPMFQYRATWRRCLEVQARQVLGVLDGSQVSYRGMRVR